MYALINFFVYMFSEV